jgi:hypothetical protein
MRLPSRTSFPAPTPEERRRNIAALKWGLFDRFGYTPHSAQIDFHLSPARFRMIIAGTRGGKSRAAGEEAVPYLFAGATRIWIVGQNYSLTEKEFRYVYDRMTSQEVLGMFSGVSPLENAVYNESQGNMFIRTKWGSTVKCISLEKPGGAFGEEVDLIIMSEAAQIKNPKRIFQQVLRGRLASRLGDVIIPTTPAGRKPKHDDEEWLFEMYNKGLDPDEEGYFTREWPSWENPAFMENPYELRAELDPLIFAEQYEGRFVVFTGALYSKFSPEIHVIAPFKIPTHWYRYEAIDPGFSGEFAWIAAVVSEAGNVFIIDEYSDSECLYKDRVEAIKNRRCEEYGIPHGMWDVFARKNNIRTTLYIDPEDPQCLAELMTLGLPGLKANNNVMVGIDRVSRRLNWSSIHTPSLYVTADCLSTVECFEKHSWGEKNTVGIRKPANDKYKHKMDCVRYICAGSIVPSPPPVQPMPQEETLWEMMMQLSNRFQRDPYALSAYERRMGGVYR